MFPEPLLIDGTAGLTVEILCQAGDQESTFGFLLRTDEGNTFMLDYQVAYAPASNP